MRIISKFRDYYDSSSGYGVDLECVYNREEVEIELKQIIGNTSQKKYPQLVTNDNMRGNGYAVIYSAIPQVLGFCGQLIPFVEIHYKTNSSYLSSMEKAFFYDAKSLLSFFKEHGFSYSRYSYFSRKDDYYDLRTEDAIKHFFNSKFSGLESFFEEHRVPIFLYGNDHGKKYLIKNPCLKNISFTKVKDSVSCFQDIFMYLSGVLGNKEKEIVAISDKDKINQHGFDKWSFRKMPSKT